jgi:hypothetical protein
MHACNSLEKAKYVEYCCLVAILTGKEHMGPISLLSLLYAQYLSCLSS